MIIDKQEDFKELDKTLVEYISQYDLPGIAVGIVSNDNLFTMSRGVRALGQSEKLLEKDVLHIGSNGKAMTATMIAVLVERGILSWDSTPADIYTETAAEISPEFRSVTLRQLLCHTAGIPSFADEQEFKNIPELHDSVTEQRLKFAKWILASKPFCEPETFNYSNAGFVIAASMAETKTQQSWEALMSELLFQPLGIKAQFGWPTGKDRPSGHIEVDGKLRIASLDYMMPKWLAPAGDISISLPDYMSFLKCHLKGLNGQSTLLNKNTFEILHKSYVHLPNAQLVKGSKGTGFACGWGLQKLNGATCHVHAGSGGTFYICAALIPDKNFGVAVASNAGGNSAEKACGELLKQLIAKHMDKIDD